MRASIQQAIQFYLGQRKQLDKQIEQATGRCQALQEKAAILSSCKGVGRVTTAVVLCELPEQGTLNRGQIAKLVGVAPIAKDSGQQHGYRRIAGGRRLVRRAIYMATLVAIRWNDRIRTHYQHLRRKGKPAKVALVACMRKLLTILNSRIKNRTPWGENRLTLDGP